MVAVLFLAMGIFNLRLDKKASFIRPLLYLCANVCLWLLACAFAFNAKAQDVLLFWIKVQFAGFSILPAALLHLASVYARRYDKKRTLIFTAYALQSAFACFIFVQMSFAGLQQYFWGFSFSAGFLPNVFLLSTLFFIAAGIMLLRQHYRSLTVGDLTKKRTKYLIVAFCFAAFSIVDVFPGYGIAIYPLGYLAMLCFVISFTYAVVRYHNLVIANHAKELEIKIEEKTKEVSRVLEELRTMQLKLIETGKISALASLSAGILHQISQPITAIHGFVKFMKKEMKDTEPFYKAIVIMEEQSTYLKDMLEDLMELIRHREIKKENVDINPCIKRAVNLLTDELRIRRINWDTVLAENLPAVYADCVHLQQIFMNIIVNAMEALSALPKGSTRYIKITSAHDNVKNQITVSFEDTGPGINKETQAQIFEPFFSTKAKGAGIGLALCKDLIAEHGGVIDIHSEENKGTTFIVRLPASKNILENLTVQKT